MIILSLCFWILLSKVSSRMISTLLLVNDSRDPIYIAMFTSVIKMFITQMIALWISIKNDDEKEQKSKVKWIGWDIVIYSIVPVSLFTSCDTMITYSMLRTNNNMLYRLTRMNDPIFVFIIGCLLNKNKFIWQQLICISISLSGTFVVYWGTEDITDLNQFVWLISSSILGALSRYYFGCCIEKIYIINSHTYTSIMTTFINIISYASLSFLYIPSINENLLGKYNTQHHCDDILQSLFILSISTFLQSLLFTIMQYAIGTLKASVITTAASFASLILSFYFSENINRHHYQQRIVIINDKEIAILGGLMVLCGSLFLPLRKEQYDIFLKIKMICTDK